MILTRRATESDLHFVQSSWLRSFWESGNAPKCDYATYYHGYGAVIRAAAPLVVVAAFEAVPDEIVGYVARGQTVAHWVYVKMAYRHQGVATKLLTGIKEYTTLTKAGKALGARLEAKYNPWAKEEK